MKLTFEFTYDWWEKEVIRFVAILNQYDPIRRKRCYLQFGPVSVSYEYMKYEGIKKQFPYQLRVPNEESFNSYANYLYKSPIFKRDRLNIRTSYLEQRLVMVSGKKWKLSYTSNHGELEVHDVEFAVLIKTVQDILSLNVKK